MDESDAVLVLGVIAVRSRLSQSICRIVRVWLRSLCTNGIGKASSNQCESSEPVVLSWASADKGRVTAAMCLMTSPAQQDWEGISKRLFGEDGG